LKSKKSLFLKDAVGGAQPNISQNLIKNTVIPIPPLAEQERIVAELDLLSSIIDKKKAQLKELDQLAQSIFYTMFGDPITNEKAWEVKKLGEACKLMAGGDVPRERFSKEKTKTYSVPVFSNGIENCGLYGYTDIPKITEKSITISGRGTIGFVAKRKEPFYPIIRLIVVTPINDIDITYLEYYAISMHFDGNGVAIPQLTVPMIKNVPIPLPPLPLQQEFASKIEAIERQKSLIQQSIDEVQTLFDSRMDYWFG
jgi:restriction endonuclease S subunit